MKTLYFILMAIFALYLTSCKKDKTEQEKSMIDKDAKVYAIFIDGTGSYKQLPKAKQTIASLIKSAPAGSKIFVHWITGNTNSDENSIISANIPEQSSSGTYANSKTKQKNSKVQNQIISVKNQLIKQVMSVSSPKAKRTDIYGAIFAATERFANYNKQGILIMFSDLADNVNEKYENLSLNGAEVRILDFQTDKKGENKRFWNDKFIELGASEVSFRHTDEIFTTK